MRTVKLSYDKFALWHTLAFIIIGILIFVALNFGDGSNLSATTIIFLVAVFLFLIYFFRTYLLPATKGSSPLIITEEKIFIRQSNTTIYWSKVSRIELFYLSRTYIIKFSLQDKTDIYFWPHFFVMDSEEILKVLQNFKSDLNLLSAPPKTI